VKRFVLMSSVRAQTGPTADHVLGEIDAPRPTDAYGRSKLAAEAALRASGVPFTILRPALVYGPGVKGNLRALARLAAIPLPLPFGSFANRRSLLARSNLVNAIAFVLENPATQGELYLVADSKPVTLAELLATLRSGLGRRPGLLPVPPGIFASLLKAVGRDDLWNRLGGALVVSSDKLVATGWRANPDTMAELTAVAVGNDSNERAV
jgi:nucleoside-diphosphate-sugar epimerase